MAMKEIELTTRVDTEMCKRIVRELEVLKHGKNCPFIIDYYGALYNQNVIYIFMEHMDVGALDQLLGIPGIERLPEVFCGKIAVSAILGLQFLKERLKIIHRDIKPSNILLNSKGETKVCDFSISGTLVKSCVDTYVGTMYYMVSFMSSPDFGRLCASATGE